MTRFTKVSALKKNSVCAIVEERGNPSVPDPESMQCWVVGFFGSASHVLHHVTGSKLVGLWQSKKGALFVVDIDGTFLGNPTPKTAPSAWTRIETGLTPKGLWGLADDAVYTWSVSGGHVLRFDGSGFTPLPPLGDEIAAIHGKSAKSLFAVGSGVAARWDGAKWHPIPVEDEDVFTGVHVVADDDVWIAGHGGLYRAGKDEPVTLVAESDDVCHAVVRHRGKIFVASEDPGLMFFDEDEGALVAPDDAEDVACRDLDGRGLLFVASDNEIRVWGEDGEEGPLGMPLDLVTA